MGLADSLEANKSTLKGPMCSVCHLTTRLDPKERAVLESAFNDDVYTSAAITRALKAEGHEVSTHSVARHRRGECRSRGA